MKSAYVLFLTHVLDSDEQLTQAAARMQHDMDKIALEVKEAEQALNQVRASKSALEHSLHEQTLKIGELRANAMVFVFLVML